MAQAIITDSTNASPADAASDRESPLHGAFVARYTLDGVLSLLSDDNIDQHMATEESVYSRFNAILAAFAVTLNELDSELWELSRAEAARLAEGRS